MIERKFVTEKIKEFRIQEYVRHSLKNAGLSHIKVQKTPLGEKIIVYTSRPGLVVGRKGQNIKQLTKVLKKEFELENPQIEISEVENLGLNASIMAENVSTYLEKFGTKNFKGIGHKIMTRVMDSGALGVEIILSGKIPSSRAKSWRFYSGYLRKCGDVSIEGVHRAYAVAQLKSGIVGIKLAIMPPDIKLPDSIQLLEEKEEVIEEVKEEAQEGEEQKKEIKKKPAKKKEAKKESEEEELKEEKNEDKGNKVDE
jgi:small subunit ribosomal protein S3